jgi:hypothetical protein
LCKQSLPQVTPGLLLVVFDGHIRARDDGLDDALSILALSGAGGIKRGKGVLELEPMSNEWLEVDLARCNERNCEGIIARLIKDVS